MREQTVHFLKGLCGLSKEERCGYVLDDDTLILVTNVAADPTKEFEFKMEEQLRIVDELRPHLVGIFHTHPSGNNRPSKKDVEGWPLIPGFRYWIATTEKVIEWKLEDDKPKAVWSSR